MKFMQRVVNTIFIMLGNSCNMSCAYCLQHPLIHHQIPATIDPVIYDFIKSVKEENGEAPLRLQFYGGEPLLYFNNIKEIVNKTKDMGINYSIISNGRAMTDEMVEFFNDNDMPVTISWDGPHVKETRGFDVFRIGKPLRRRLLRINQLGLSAVLSAKTYPIEVLDAFQSISDDYYKLHQYPIYINLDEIFDTGLPDKTLLNVDYDRVEQEMKLLTATHIKSIIEGKQERKDYTKNAYISRLISMVSSCCNSGKEFSREFSACGNGFNVLNMDLSGNLYSCHNTCDPVGNVRDSYFSYIGKIMAGETLQKHKEECSHCPAVILCQGGCKLVSDEARKSTYCKMKRAVFTPVLSVLQNYGAGLEMN